jgi:TonB family protein
MKVQVEPGTEEIPDLQLLLDWNTPLGKPRIKEAAMTSIGLHLLVLCILFLLPSSTSNPPDEERFAIDVRNATPLIAPPFELTQRAPNRGKISKELNLEGLLARPRVFLPPAPEGLGRSASVSKLTPPPKVTPLSELPKDEAPPVVAQAPLPPPPAPPPQIQTEEKPKLAFEKPGASSSVPAGSGIAQAKITPPRSSVEEAMRTVARGGGGGTVVVGNEGGDAGGLGGALNLPGSTGTIGSSLELLSDPEGVDFRPYLIKILSSVRRNWLAVIPESAKLGRRGKVVIQFAIDREGRVPKLVIAMPSGTQALDRAAVAGVSASNPFPPLPPEFTGDQVRLQFNFLYNMRER